MLKLHRGNLRTLLVIFCLLFMSYSSELFNSGVFVFFCGLLLHFISKGFLNRGIEVAVRGPYSFFRHPFYIANLLLDTGIILMSGHPVFIIIYIFLYYKSYHKVIFAEETELLNIYGDSYKNYIQAVPRYLPRIKPYAKDWCRGFKWGNIIKERELSRLLRLISYPIAFLIVHEIVKYKIHQPKIIEVLLGIGFCILLIWTSYLLHNMVERERIFKNISPKTINIIFLISLALVFIVTTTVSFAETESDGLMMLLTLFFVVLGILFVNLEKYKVYFIGDCFFIIALCIFSGLFWMIPVSLFPVVFIIVYSHKRRFDRKTLFLPVKIRLLLYFIICIFLLIKEFYC